MRTKLFTVNIHYNYNVYIYTKTDLMKPLLIPFVIALFVLIETVSNEAVIVTPVCCSSVYRHPY